MTYNRSDLVHSIEELEELSSSFYLTSKKSKDKYQLFLNYGNEELGSIGEVKFQDFEPETRIKSFELYEIENLSSSEFKLILDNINKLSFMYRFSIESDQLPIVWSKDQPDILQVLIVGNWYQVTCYGELYLIHDQVGILITYNKTIKEIVEILKHLEV